MWALIASRNWYLALLLLTLVAACSADRGRDPAGRLMSPPGQVPPAPTGDLVVRVTPGLGNGDRSISFSVTVVGQGTNVSQHSATMRLSELAPGNYRVELALGNSLILPRCRVQPSSRQVARVAAGRTTSVEFRIYCDWR